MFDARPEEMSDPTIHNQTSDLMDVGCLILSAKQLLDESRALAESVSPDLWGRYIRAGNVTLFVGESSAGKTVLLHRLACHLATGAPFLGIAPSHPLRVLYVDFETPTEVFVEHLDAMGAPEGLDFVQPGPKFEPGVPFLIWLTGIIKRHKYDVVIIDSIMEAYPVKDENDNPEATKQMQQFRALARSTGAGVVLVHNAGARRKATKFMARGATARVDRADLVLNYTVVSDAVRRLQTVKARSGTLNESLDVRFARTLDFDVTCSPVPHSKLSGQLEEVMDFITREAGVGGKIVERKAILHCFGIMDKTPDATGIDRALKELVKTGQLTKSGKGRYALPEREGVRAH